MRKGQRQYSPGKEKWCVKSRNWLTAHENLAAWSQWSQLLIESTWQSCSKFHPKTEFVMCGCVVRHCPRCACVCITLWVHWGVGWGEIKFSVIACEVCRRNKLKQSVNDETRSACGWKGLCWCPKVRPVISCTPTSLRVHTSVVFTSLRQPMKLLLTGDPGRSAVLGLPPT